jgi:rhamnosyltransferase
MKTSILIRTKNEESAINTTLKLIRSQSLQPNEIIVVDSGSTDRTVEYIRAWKNIHLIQIPSEEFTYGRALNIGFEIANGDIVVSLSAHAFPSTEHWLEMLIRNFENPKVAAVYGRQLPHINAWPPVQRDYLSYYGTDFKVQDNPNNSSHCCFSNANSAIRRALWLRQPFNETLPYSEDQEWAINALTLGYQIIYEPKAAVYHSHNESFMKVYRRSYNEYSAYKELYGGKFSFVDASLNWYYSVKSDIKFVLKNRNYIQWIVLSPFYRFFLMYGKFRAFNEYT